MVWADPRLDKNSKLKAPKNGWLEYELTSYLSYWVVSFHPIFFRGELRIAFFFCFVSGRDSFLGSFSFQSHTPPKTNMEPKDGGLEDDFPFKTGDFQVPC